MRYSGYRSMEKKIAASDSGGIYERWRYGRTLLTDESKVTASGNLQHGVLAKLIGEARKAGTRISEREIQYRLKCARAYPTEAEIRTACADFEVWSDLRAAGFPQVEAADSGDPYDPHAATRKPPMPPTQPTLTTADGRPVPAFEPPVRFGGDEHGPRSTVEDLYAACKESEGYTERMAANDAKRRGYVDELRDAVGGDLTKTWYEAEQRRRGLGALGVTDWESAAEIVDDIWRRARERDELGRLDGQDDEDDE